MQEGGSQYGVSPEMTPFTATATRTHMLGDTHHLQTVEAASPISSRPPAVARPSGNFDELVQVSGSFPDDDSLAGDDGDRGVSGGNRWPRQETLALLKIRSEMDSDFRNATLKGPLWEDVSRKLAELGYIRNAKKCKEKFENVHKYYKRTKEGRAGRQDGKSYRFFTQLEALQSSSNTAMPTTTTTTTTPTNLIAAPISIGIGISHPMIGSSARTQPPSISVTPATAATHIGVSSAGITTAVPGSAPATADAGITFSSDTSSSSSDSEDDLEGEPSNTDSRKRKRGSRGGSSSRKMMAFFEGLMKQVMEKQEAMQQRFLETIEKREQDRMIRDEAWKRQEMARLNREHEIMAQERAISASRDAAIIAFLQKITGQTIQFPSPITIPVALPPQSTQPPPSPVAPPHHHPHHHHQQHHHQQQQQQQQQHNQSQSTEIVRHQSASSDVIIAVPEQQQPPQEMGSGPGGAFDPSSSRWPKAEVLALIKLRSGLESRYQEAGPKGPLWEEVSVGMQRMGYNRSSKRCKEKWENINKYFKKVKESNKKRPEDAKTCPYFHQLDALYRKKILGSSSGGGSGSFGNQNKQEQESVNTDPNPTTRRDVLEIMPLPQPASQATVVENKDKNNKDSGTEVQTSNGGSPGSLLGEGSAKKVLRDGLILVFVLKPADIVKELIEQQQLVMDVYDKIEEPDSDNLDPEDDEDDDEDEGAEEERKMAYKIEFQRQNTGSTNGGGNGAESFLAMVQ
ncbi:hypothetical protein HHK36_021692 [Tetracentron sinense]|uniref:Myb-like domain-containing protein n=1 Tax=Tetracentron sinense TaxID=13715 RepID=A0A835D7L3_TETSI|nr:hypothetical protein HHK36_021692 [Tetracentron sinense]